VQAIGFFVVNGGCAASFVVVKPVSRKNLSPQEQSLSSSSELH
jgi:hypothetical protein